MVVRGRKRKLKRKQIGTIILVVGAVLLGMSALGLCLAYSSRRGNDFLVAMSDSMEPTFREGDVVKVKLGVNASEIHVDDIIAFREFISFQDIIVSRVIARKFDGMMWYFETRGDANLESDGWVPESSVIGEVVEINPPLWTYNYVFLIFILGLGIVLIAFGVAVRLREPAKVGGIEEKSTPVLTSETVKRFHEVKTV